MLATHWLDELCTKVGALVLFALAAGAMLSVLAAAQTAVIWLFRKRA